MFYGFFFLIFFPVAPSTQRRTILVQYKHVHIKRLRNIPRYHFFYYLLLPYGFFFLYSFFLFFFATAQMIIIIIIVFFFPTPMERKKTDNICTRENRSDFNNRRRLRIIHFYYYRLSARIVLWNSIKPIFFFHILISIAVKSRLIRQTRSQRGRAVLFPTPYNLYTAV